MKLVLALASGLAALAVAATGVDGGDEPRVGVVADRPAAVAAEAGLERAEQALGVDGQLRLPRDRFERTTDVRYLRATGREVIVVRNPRTTADEVFAAVARAAR